MIGPRTRCLGVLGWPVGHSFSPAMQNAALAALGLDWVYGAFAVAPDQLATAIRGAAALGFAGLNLTIPHKEAALALCDPDAEAALAGAVNTLVFTAGGRPRGHNTDVYGFRQLLVEAKVEVRGARAAVLGAGGAARAVVLALRAEGATAVVVSRSARRLVFADGSTVEHRPWTGASLETLLPTVDLLVDATPRGLVVDGKAPAEVALLGRHATVIDIAAKRPSALIQAADGRGLRTAMGTAMLLHQGVRALESWTGRPAPVEVMRAALAEAIAQP